MSWARATLRRGTSSAAVWQIDSSYPEARLSIGAAPNAGWVVEAPGVALVHVELYWDGNALYVADARSAGDVRLDGRVIGAWEQVRGRGQLVFGHAILELETSVAEVSALIRDPGTAPRVSLAGEATRVADGAPLDDERTRVASGPSESDDDDVLELDEIPSSKAMISVAPAPRAPAAPAASGAAARPAPPGPEPARPRLGGGPAAPRAPAAALPAENLSPIGQEATRMVDMELVASGAPAAAPAFQPIAPLGAPGAAPFGGAQPPFGGAQPPFGGAQPPFGGAQPPQGQAPSSFPLGSPGPGASQPAFGAGPPSEGGGVPSATGGFVPPPAMSAQTTPMGEVKLLPRRTWLMIGLFVAVVVAWLMMPTPEDEEAERRSAAPPPVAAADAGVPAARRAFVNPSTFTPVLTEELVDGGLARTPDAIAAQLVADGRIEDALAQYDALRLAHPDRPEYAVMCEVLRRQLMQRCVHGQRWDGTPCP